MHDANAFLLALATVLGVAAITTVLFRKLRQPVVLGYLLAGVIIGPHVPVPLVADAELVHTLSELGVILLMFSLGLEFSLKSLLKVGVVSGFIAVLSASVLLWLGFTTGQLLGWTTQESIFTGAIVAISSTTIVIKAFNERVVDPKLRELVVGVLIAQDLVAMLLLASLTALAGGGLDAGALLTTTAKLAAFLVGLLAIGMLTVPRAIRSVTKLAQPETTLVAAVGLCFGTAALAAKFGYSVALGAFIAGSLISESGQGRVVEKLVEPVRDVFAAIFFVSVGMMIDPSVLLEQRVAVVVLTVVVIVGQSLAVFTGALLTGNGLRTSVQAGMSLAQIGEFSFIIAGVGLASGATRPFLYPLAIAVSVVTTFTTPWMIRASDPLARLIDRKLPARLQTLSSLYQSWVEQLRATKTTPQNKSGLWRLLRLLAIDVALLVAVVVGTALGSVWLVDSAVSTFGVSEGTGLVVVLGTAAVIALPLCLGIVRLARRVGTALATLVLPDVDKSALDLAAAPRRALVVTLQLAVVLVVGIPLVALTRPFLPGAQGAIVLLMLLVFLGVGFWRSATNLQGHVRAGAQVIVDALGRQANAGKGANTSEAALVDVHKLLPGLGEPVPVALGDDSPAVGKSLRELNLRGMTGATVLALIRDGKGVLVPSAKEPLQKGDILALAGSHDAVAAARVLLTKGPDGPSKRVVADDHAAVGVDHQ